MLIHQIRARVFLQCHCPLTFLPWTKVLHRAVRKRVAGGKQQQRTQSSAHRCYQWGARGKHIMLAWIHVAGMSDPWTRCVAMFDKHDVVDTFEHEEAIYLGAELDYINGRRSDQ